jgi:Fe-S cluster assembly protein SufD
MNAVASPLHDRYLAAFERIALTLPGQRLGWLQRARQAALERFAELGFPTPRQEDWKYTRVNLIEQGDFTPLPPADVTLAQQRQIAGLALAGAYLMVFVDGYYRPELSQLSGLPDGVRLASVADGLECEPAELEPWLELDDAKHAPAFGALNHAFFNDGAWLRLQAGAMLKEPIHLLYLASRNGALLSPRNVIVAEQDSHATVVEHHVALSDAAYFTNAVTTVALAADAELNYHQLQQHSLQACHIDALAVSQQHGSRFKATALALGARLARSDIRIGLNTEHAGCEVDGLAFAGGRQHLDHHLHIDHHAGHGTSRVAFKGIADEAARVVFHGRVVVHPDAQQSDARETSRNLLLSDKAEVDSRPQLEIYADDVKCSHGATVGALDADQVFYLRARGLSESAARALLIHAFAADTVARLALPPLEARVEALLHARLEGAR